MAHRKRSSLLARVEQMAKRTRDAVQKEKASPPKMASATSTTNEEEQEAKRDSVFLDGLLPEFCEMSQEEEAKHAEGLEIGQHVYVFTEGLQDVLVGMIRYKGAMHFDKRPDWIGVDFGSDEMGKHNGTIKGRTYFETISSKSGRHVRPKYVQVVPEFIRFPTITCLEMHAFEAKTAKARLAEETRARKAQGEELEETRLRLKAEGESRAVYATKLRYAERSKEILQSRLEKAEEEIEHTRRKVVGMIEDKNTIFRLKADVANLEEKLAKASRRPSPSSSAAAESSSSSSCPSSSSSSSSSGRPNQSPGRQKRRLKIRVNNVTIANEEQLLGNVVRGRENTDDGVERRDLGQINEGKEGESSSSSSSIPAKLVIENKVPLTTSPGLLSTVCIPDAKVVDGKARGVLEMLDKLQRQHLLVDVFQEALFIPEVLNFFNNDAELIDTLMQDSKGNLVHIVASP
eukprot:jgi/Bigna1/87423/estExt_fgenesh1_pg.C_200088